MKRLFLLIAVIIFITCTDEKPLFNGDYFIGEWDWSYKVYRCCETCFSTYEKDCLNEEDSNSEGEAIIFENGMFYSLNNTNNYESETTWCYDDINNQFVRKEIGGGIYNFNIVRSIIEVNENSFVLERRLSSRLYIYKYTRK